MVKYWVGAVALAATSVAWAEGESTTIDWKIEVAKPQRRKQSWGVSVGAYFPKSEEIRDLFGDTLVRFGVSPVSRKFDKDWDITTDVNVLWANENGARLLVIPLTVGATIGFGAGDARWYVAANAGPAYYNYRLYRLEEGGGGKEGPVIVEYKDKTFGWNANIEGGVLFNNRLSVTGRYDWFKKADDFDFSGFSVNVNYAFFRW